MEDNSETYPNFNSFMLAYKMDKLTLPSKIISSSNK